MVMHDGTPIVQVPNNLVVNVDSASGYRTLETTLPEYKNLGEVTEITIEEKTRGQLMGDLDSLVEKWETVIGQVDSLSENIHQVRGELGSRFGIRIALDKFDIKSPIPGRAVPVVPGIVIVDPDIIEKPSNGNPMVAEDVNLEVPVKVPIDTRTASQIHRESLEMNSSEAQMEEREFTDDMSGRFSGILESAFKTPVDEFTATSEGKVVTRGYR